MKTNKKKKLTAWEKFGFIKGGKPFNAVEEIKKMYVQEYEKTLKKKRVK